MLTLRNALSSFTTSVCVLIGLVGCASAAEPEKTDQADGVKYLIIHADDAGMSHSVNKGTIDSMEKGIVSSASIMVPCPWFPEWAKYARENPEGCYGIHLTLTNEWEYYRWGPVAPLDEVPSLVNKEGDMWDTVPEVAANVKAHEVEIELRAQIDKSLEYGVPLSHLDTHMGAVISRPDLLEIYVNLGIEYDLPVMWVRSFDEAVAKEYPALAERGEDLLKVIDKQGLPVLNGIGQFYGGETHEERVGNYRQFLQGLQPGVTQLIIHCGYDNEELQHITTSASRRDGDRRIFMDPEIMGEIEELGIQVINWKQFREMYDRPVQLAD